MGGCAGGCSQTCKQFLLLLWKNFILQIRRPIGTVFEILLPIVAVVFILVLRVALFDSSDKCFVTFDSDNLNIPYNVEGVQFSEVSYNIFYTPNTGQAAAVAAILRAKLPDRTVNLTGFETEDAMVLSLQAISPPNVTTCFRNGAGIVFEELEGNDISYKLRLRHEVGQQNSWNTDLVGPAFEIPGPRVRNSYLSEGFLQLQQLVSQSIIEWKAGGISDPIEVSMRQFPYPPYREDFFLETISAFLPILLVMAFLYSAGIVVKELVVEKESRIRESMLMMGLKQWVLWATWYLKQFLFLLISVIVMSILLKLGVFRNSDFFLILIFLILFICSMISFCFFISVWFDSSRVGFIVGFVAWFVNYFPFLFIPMRYETLGLGVKISACLLSNTCLGLGVEVLSRLELRQEGLTWANAASPVSADDNFNMAWVFLMLIVDSILYLAVAWYVNAVKPGQYGVPQPFYFPFLPSYWCESVRCSSMKPGIQGEGYQEDPSAHEEVATDLSIGISIRNLTKIYSQSIFQRLLDLVSCRNKFPKKAVDNLNLSIYKGQITALLGHNGAGKTTTMSMLTGLYTPTSGTAEIGGYNIQTEMNLVRRSLGICPQHNILFDRLTVSEHLAFFLRLKGIYNKKRVRKEVEDMIADLLLVGKSKIQSSRLSGGMKRKLSVGIALIGGSDVVILDEPTSGMDPYARRATWDLLIKHKQNRTMLLTTHFMDEADILGDRIAIMAEGKLCCSGSSLFLKSRYGVGYHMTIVKAPGCVSEKVEELVHTYVSEAEQVTDVGAELSFTLPSSATAKFPELFDRLDGQKAELGVSSFGVSVTTMEEVFMKVGEDSGESLDQRLRRVNSAKVARPVSPIGQTRVTSPPNNMGIEVVASLDSEMPHLSAQVAEAEVAETVFRNSEGETLVNVSNQLTYNFKPNTGLTLWVQQFWALFVKRFYNSLRFYGALFSQLFLPLLFVVLGLAVAITVPSNQTDDAPRALLLNNSGLTPDNATTFFAQFGSSLNFSGLSAEDILATDYFDFTGDVESTMTRVKASLSNQSSDCCRYQYQLLDKYCATLTAEELMSACGENNDAFGYSRCEECLSCCTATDIQSSVLPSCSRPGSVFGSVENSGFCPSPPSLSASDVGATATASGTLDAINTYVAEQLLIRSVELDQAVFFRRYLAGFTLAAQDPVFSVCNCQPPQAGAVPGACTLLDNFLKPCVNESCLSYSAKAAVCPSNDSIPLCDRPAEACYSVDGFSADITRALACNSMCGTSSNRQVSTLYPDQLSTPAVTVWYNNAPFHASPAALNAFHNIYLKQVTGLSDVTLTVINHPLPRNDSSRLNAAASDPTGFGISTLVVFGYSFLLASFVLFLVAEKESKAKHLQFVSGVSPTSYWLSSFVWDLINALLPVVITIIIFAAFQVEAFSGPALGAIFLVLILTCWASIPFTYMFSFLFSNSLAAFGILMLYFFFFAFMALTIVFLVQFTVNGGTAVADVLHYIFLLCPTYGLATSLNDIYLNQNVKSACAALEARNFSCDFLPEGVRFVDNPLDVRRPGVGITCIVLFLEGVVFFLLTLLIQRKFFYSELRNLVGSSKTQVGADVAEPLLHGEDSDVNAERKKVMSGAIAENDVVVIRDLVKVYSAHVSGCSIRKAKKAVSGINLAIPNGECFGLLGVNGAGKTTTFSILTGEIAMSSGSALIAGYDVSTRLKDVQQRVGYCPQFDALIERLTGREQLTMFARLRGIPEKQIKEVVDTEVRRLDLAKHASKRSSTYSGGNKRKLSTAIALVGNPPIVMLDEPSTGMDPTTRRHLWDVLTNITKEGRSIILTSHSMEECEALCTRLAIMVNGSFKCLGSTQHLKNKYGAGFTLQAKVRLGAPPQPAAVAASHSSLHASLRRSNSRDTKSQSKPSGSEPVMVSEATDAVASLGSNTSTTFNPFDTAPLHTFVKEAFSGAILLEEHQGAVTYQLPSAGVTWSTVFRQLENNKQRLGIVDYSVSQTTLDQVFINFAREQEDGE